MAPGPKQNPKPVFKTASPFTETKWPELSRDDQDVILELLCNLLTPLGNHRRTHIPPSKGKNRKRKRTTTTAPLQHNDPPPPPPPPLTSHLLIGLNSITRHLESLAASTTSTTTTSAAEPAKRLTMVFLTHPKPSLSPAHAHLPTLLHLSTLSPGSNAAPPTGTVTPTGTPSVTPTRLIPLPSSSEARLASSLSIPRVGAVALFAGAPGAEALEEYVAGRVGVTECRWVDEVMGAEWRGLRVAG